MKKPLVSVITPTYNSADTIVRTLASVTGQSFKNWEHIIVDDASSDKTCDILATHCTQNDNVHLIRMDTNKGAGFARNIGIEAAQGKYIAFLDSDDLWLPQKLERQLQFMEVSDIAFSFTGFERVDEWGNILGKVKVPEMCIYSDLLKNNRIGCLTAIYDSEKLGKVYMPEIRKRQDLGLWLRILKITPIAYGMPDILAQYRIRKDSISANKTSSARYTWQLYRDFERLSFLKATYYFVHYAANGIVKTYLTNRKM